jgi:hypothetical protein
MTEKEIYDLGFIPHDLEYGGDHTVSVITSDQLLPILEEVKAEACFYWYSTGSYEGSGEMIILRDNEWHLLSISHCSCYGPTEKIAEKMQSQGFTTFTELEAACTNEYKKSVSPLITLIKEKGYGPALPDEINIGIL